MGLSIGLDALGMLDPDGRSLLANHKKIFYYQFRFCYTIGR